MALFFVKKYPQRPQSKKKLKLFEKLYQKLFTFVKKYDIIIIINKYTSSELAKLNEVIDMKIRYEMKNFRDGEILVAEHIKDLVDYMGDNNLTDEQVEFSYKKED